MAITVKFFSSIRETMGQSEQQINQSDVSTVLDVWTKSTEGAELPINTLIAINMDYVDRDHLVKDGDEVAFFPPVSGG
jgi:molybdopterin synthase sulfur carrier subunit